MSFLGFARACGAVVLGIDGHLVEVEAHIGPGLPEFRLIGLPDAAVRESRDRVRAALRQCGVTLPAGRITVNLAPAQLRKPGSSLDLAIACAVLAACGRIPSHALAGQLFVGEVSLDGSLRPVDGVVPLLLAGRRAGLRRAVVPRDDLELAALVDGLAVWPAAGLQEVVEGLARGLAPKRDPGRAGAVSDAAALAEEGWDGADLAEVRGQALARRALEIAAAGGHHLMLLGPPGSGKTMLAQRLPSILPPLSADEWLEVVQIYSAAGHLGDGRQVPLGAAGRLRRPFRAPHYSITRAGLIGGGGRLAPGELTLAHRGVLFLDEFAELDQQVIDALREPMEQGWVTLVRGSLAARMPADVLVVAASNPCPCGRLGLPQAAGGCRCRTGDLARYRRRLAGPVADRFDLWVFVRPVGQRQLLCGLPGESSREVRRRVMAARERQRRRLGPEGSGQPFAAAPLNGRMTPEQVRRWCRLSPEVEAEALRLSRRLSLSARAMQGVLKVARTLADLEGRPSIEAHHLREAAQFRRTEQLWG